MFTGIVTEMGRVTVQRMMASATAAVELEIEAPKSAPRLSMGASIAVNGVCQTVVGLTSTSFKVQAVGATLDLTTLGRLAGGSPVNLEPSLRMGDELGGHLVMGHVDGMARIEQILPRADAVYLTISLAPDLARFAAPRGSLAVDGTSLTIARADGDRVTFSLIPHTIANTIAHVYKIGDLVNIEVDLLARYLDRLLGERTTDRSSALTWEILKEKFS